MCKPFTRLICMNLSHKFRSLCFKGPRFSSEVHIPGLLGNPQNSGRGKAFGKIPDGPSFPTTSPQWENVLKIKPLLNVLKHVKTVKKSSLQTIFSCDLYDMLLQSLPSFHEILISLPFFLFHQTFMTSK